jgi:CheY-like chemotaxis protein
MSDSNERTPRLDGCHVLVVEDDYFLAVEICNGLRACGAVPIGPAGSVSEGLSLVGDAAAMRCAVLDIKLRGEPSFTIARELEARGIPFVYVSGYDEALESERPRGTAHFVKPVDRARLLELVEQLCSDVPQCAAS